MLGEDGLRSNNNKMTWEIFANLQRWYEFPERSNDPPMTVDFAFIYNGKQYYIDSVNYEYAILSREWKVIVSCSNFLELLLLPVDEWKGMSFKEIIEYIQIEE